MISNYACGRGHTLRIAFGITVLILLLGSIGEVSAETNLIINGDFETGNFIGWDTSKTLIPGTYIDRGSHPEIAASQVNGGSFSAYFYTTDQQGYEWWPESGRIDQARQTIENVDFNKLKNMVFEVWTKYTGEYINDGGSIGGVDFLVYDTNGDPISGYAIRHTGQPYFADRNFSNAWYFSNKPICVKAYESGSEWTHSIVDIGAEFVDDSFCGIPENKRNQIGHIDIFIYTFSAGDVDGDAILYVDDLSVMYRSVPATTTFVSIFPSTATVIIDSTRIFTATDQNGDPISVDWSSNDINVGTVYPATGASTIFTALKKGVAIVMATRDGVGGSAEVNVPAKTTAISLSGTTGNNGWYTDDITVTLTAPDNEGGPEMAFTEYTLDGTIWNRYSGPFVIENEGTTTIGFRSVDIEGNSEQTKNQEVKIDKTAPIIDGAPTLLPNANGWYNKNVIVRFSCQDGVSGPVDPFYDVFVNYIDGAFSDGYFSIDGTCRDKAGNEASKTLYDFNVDRRAEIITGSRTPASNENGWNNDDVTVHFDCTEGMSGLDSCTPDIVVSSEGAGQRVTGTVIDKAGNTASTTVDGINIDKTAPTISITTPAAYDLYMSGTALSFSASDVLSGLDGSATGLLIDTAGVTSSISTGFVPSPGVYTLIVEATDKAGNIAQSDKRFFVVYDPTGGFATGGGWLIPDSESTQPSGRANFGFVAKYKNGGSSGNLEFQYQDAGINLKSTSIDWLTITGVSAIFQGTATINGDGPYTFRVTAKDNAEPGVDADGFDIRIWQGLGTATEPYHKAKNVISGGNIVVHKK